MREGGGKRARAGRESRVGDIERLLA